MDTIFNGVNQLIGSTENLAKLGIIGILLFFILLLIVYVVWLQKVQAKAAESAWEGRIEEAKADEAMASALEKMRDEWREFRHTIKCGGPSA